MYERVLVGTDGSGTATRAVVGAATIALNSGAELTIAHAFSPRPSSNLQRAWLVAPEDLRWRLSIGTIAEATVQTAVERAHAVAGDDLPVVGRWEPGGPANVLLGLIDELDVDAVVIGNRDMTGWVRGHRSVGRALSRRARCDVVIIDTTGRRGNRGRGTARRPALQHA